MSVAGALVKENEQRVECGGGCGQSSGDHATERGRDDLDRQ